MMVKLDEVKYYYSDQMLAYMLTQGRDNEC